MKRILLLSFAVVAVAGLTSCTPYRAPLPEGPQTLEGVLSPAGISRARRGTHELSQNGVLTYYVESKTLNLRSYEDMSVTITGTLEHNTDPESAPVLVATEIQSAAESEERSWDLPAYGIRFSAPKSWGSTSDATATQFSVSGATMPILTIYKDEAEPLLPGAQPVVIQNMQAVRSIDEATGAQTIAIRRAHETLILLFTPRDLEPAQADLVRQQFLRLLRSLQPLSTASSARSSASAISVASTGSAGSAGSVAASAAPTFCGGAAGVLCPAGQYCAITDSVNKTGVCRTPVKK